MRHPFLIAAPHPDLSCVARASSLSEDCIRAECFDSQRQRMPGRVSAPDTGQGRPGPGSFSLHRGPPRYRRIARSVRLSIFMAALFLLIAVTQASSMAAPITATGDGQIELLLFLPHRFGANYRLRGRLLRGFIAASPDWGTAIELVRRF